MGNVYVLINVIGPHIFSKSVVHFFLKLDLRAYTVIRPIFLISHCHKVLVCTCSESCAVVKFANNKDADQPAHPCCLTTPLSLAYWKVSYLDLVRAKFQFSS